MNYATYNCRDNKERDVITGNSLSHEIHGHESYIRLIIIIT